MLWRAFPWRAVWGSLLSILLTTTSWAGARNVSPTALAPRDWQHAGRMQFGWKVPGSIPPAGAYVHMAMPAAPRVAKPIQGTLARQIDSIPRLLAAGPLGLTAGTATTAHREPKLSFRPQRPARAAHNQITPPPALRLGPIEQIARQGFHYTLPAAILNGQFAKGENIVSDLLEPLARWNLSRQNPPRLAATTAGNRKKVRLPHNQPQVHWAPREAQPGQWRLPATQAFAPAWMEDSAWTDRVLTGWVRLTQAIKLAEKPAWKVACNPAQPAPLPRLDFALLLQQAQQATRLGHSLINELSLLANRSFETAAQFQWASVLPTRRPAVAPTSPLAALCDLPSVVAATSQVRLIPAAAHGLSTASHDLFVRTCRTALHAPEWASLTQPQR